MELGHGLGHGQGCRRTVPRTTAMVRPRLSSPPLLPCMSLGFPYIWKELAQWVCTLNRGPAGWEIWSKAIVISLFEASKDVWGNTGKLFQSRLRISAAGWLRKKFSRPLAQMNQGFPKRSCQLGASSKGSICNISPPGLSSIISLHRLE